MRFDPAKRRRTAIPGAVHFVHRIEFAHVDQLVFLDLEEKFPCAFPDGAAADDVEAVEARDRRVVGVDESSIAAGGEGNEVASGFVPVVAPPRAEHETEAERGGDQNARKSPTRAAEEPDGAQQQKWNEEDMLWFRKD